MVGIMYAMLAIMLLAAIFAVVMLMKRARASENTNAEKYDVFKVYGSQLTVLTGFPVTYELDEIAKITFSVRKAPKSMSSYNGIMRIIKTGGKKSRLFLFDGSAYTKKFTLSSSKQDIERAIQYLMDELKPHHISCSRTL